MTLVAAAQDCQYETDKSDRRATDPFTNQTQQALFTQTLFTQHDQEKTEALNITLMRVDSAAALLITYMRAYPTGGKNLCLSPAPDALQILFADGTKASIPTITDNCARAQVTVDRAGTRYDYTITATFLPDAATLTKLQQQPITTYRINFEKATATINITEKLGKGWLGFGRRGNKRVNPQTYVREHISCVLP